MGDFLGDSNAQKVIKYSSLQTGRSQYDVAIPWIRGQRRVGGNCIWANDFTPHKHSAKGKGGGKGAEQYTYTAAVILAIGYGTVDAFYNVWSQGSSSTASTLGGLGFTPFYGGPGQTAWAYVTTKHPTEALAYGKVSYVAHSNLDLGSAASVPDLGFEVRCTPYADVFVSVGYENPTSHVVTDGHDCNMADVVPDFLTDPLAGCGLTGSYIPDLSDFRAAQAAQGLFFSPCLSNQEKGLDIINRWARLSNSWMYDSGTSLVVVPLADTTVTGNGYTFTPDLTPIYDFGPDDYTSDGVQVDIKDPADCHSRTTVSITDRTMGYATNPIEYKSQSLIRKYGRRDSDNVQADEICCPAVGEIVAQLIGRRSANITQTFKWGVSGDFILLLPGAIVTLTDPTQNLDAVPVRITGVGEGENGNLSFSAEELPTAIGTHRARTVQAGPKPTTPDILIDPGNVNVPAVVEPSGLIAGGKAKVLIAASGGANWGGANVWLSFDGVSYSQIGTITNPAIQGVLTANLASYGGVNPDTLHTLSVDATQSQGEPDTVTNADADALRTLSLVCAPPTIVGPNKVLASAGELLAFGNTAATGTYTANLTYLQRGALGTSAGAHSTSDLFTLFDLTDNSGTTIQYDLPAQYVGQPLYLKFASYNVFGKGTQDLSVCQAYKYTPTGLGFGSGTGGVPKTPTGLAAVGGVQQVALSWNANPSTDNVTAYQIFRAPGPGGAFGSAALVSTVNALAWTDTSLTANAVYTYFLKAVNAIGASAATAGVDVTTATANPQLGGITWSCQNIATKALNAVLGGQAMLYPGTMKSVANGGLAAGWVDVAPSVNTDFDLLKDGLSVGTLRWAAGSNAPTLIKAANTALVFDDYVDLKTPANLNGMSGVFRAGVTIAR